MNDIEKQVDDIKKVYEIRMKEYPIRTMNLTDYYKKYCGHGDVYAISDDGTVGEKIGTCSILKGE